MCQRGTTVSTVSTLCIKTFYRFCGVCRLEMVGLGHMHVGALWQNTGAGRGAPNLVKEALAAEPIYPYVYKGKSARQIVCWLVEMTQRAWQLNFLIFFR